MKAAAPLVAALFFSLLFIFSPFPLLDLFRPVGPQPEALQTLKKSPPLL